MACFSGVFGLARRMADVVLKPCWTFEDPAVSVLSTDEAVERLQRPRDGGQIYYAFYSSVMGGIVTDPSLMVLPMDDHMVHRGHGVFDTASLVKGRVSGLDYHLERFMKSCEGSRLKSPLFTRDMVTKIVLHTCKAAVEAGIPEASGCIRYWASAGPGNFHLTNERCTPQLYVVVYEDAPAGPGARRIPEATVSARQVPPKPPPFCNVKSTNYAPNALCSLAAKDAGGTFGLWLDAEGQLLEASVLGVLAVVGGEVVTRANDDILASCTVRAAVEVLATSPWRVSRRALRRDELNEAAEVVMMGGDTHLFSVSSIDGRPLPEKSPLFDFLTEKLNARARDTARSLPLP